MARRLAVPFHAEKQRTREPQKLICAKAFYPFNLNSESEEIEHSAPSRFSAHLRDSAVNSCSRGAAAVAVNAERGWRYFTGPNLEWAFRARPPADTEDRARSARRCRGPG